MLPPASRRVPGGAGSWSAFGFCCLIWGSTFLFIRVGNDTLAPVWAAALRLIVSAAILAAIAVALRRPWPRGPELEAALWFGAVDFGIGLPLLNWGEREVPSSTAAVLFATIPLTTVVFARAFGLERLRLRQVVAALGGLAGVVVLSSGPRADGVSMGSLLAVGLSAVMAALAGVLLKRAPDSDPFAMNAIAHAVGIPFCLAASALSRERPTLPAGSGAVSILYLAVVGSVGAFVTFAWLIRRWPISRANYVTVIVPVIAMLLGWSTRGEPLGPLTLFGAGVVLASVTYGLAGNRSAASRGEPATGRASADR